MNSFHFKIFIIFLSSSYLNNVNTLEIRSNLSIRQIISNSSSLTCNGYLEYCSRSFSNITYLAAHDSPNVQAGSLAANQDRTVKQQLDDGVRMLTAQGHNQNGVIQLCHTSCLLLNKGSLIDYLTDVKHWLDDHPREVISFLWVNSDNLSPLVWKAAYEHVGLDHLSYAPNQSGEIKRSEWPTLGELIEKGTRVISFIDNSADHSLVPYLLDEFSSVWETPYDETNPSFPCTIDRISSNVESSSDLMMGMNHFLDRPFTLLGINGSIPARDLINNTNSIDSILSQAHTCLSAHGHWPNFILLDFYNQPLNGSVFKAIAQINGVTYKTLSNPISSSPISSPPITSQATSSTPSFLFSTFSSSSFNPSPPQCPRSEPLENSQPNHHPQAIYNPQFFNFQGFINFVRLSFVLFILSNAASIHV